MGRLEGLAKAYVVSEGLAARGREGRPVSVGSRAHSPIPCSENQGQRTQGLQEKPLTTV